MTVIAGIVFMLVGSAFILVASIGTLRLPDFFTRMHAITTAGTIGIGFNMLAVVCFAEETSLITRAVIIMLFVALTAPVGAHMIGRAGYESNVTLWKGTFIDELQAHTKDRRSDPPDDAQK